VRVSVPSLRAHRDGANAPAAPAPDATASLAPAQTAANAALAAAWKGRVILAPLTRVGTLPFRRLCADFGASVTLSEMAFARPLAKGDRVERARLRKAPTETCFGLQIATNNVSEGLAAARLAADAGAAFIDLNCGCPIFEATRRGLGSALLRNPRKLARLVAGMAEASPLPVTVKIRLGVTDATPNYSSVVPALHAAGAALVTVHGRSGEGRYKRAADWSAVSAVALANPSMPVVGNGDALTLAEVQSRLAAPGVHAIMVGRGALIKPWLFAEVEGGSEILLDEGARVAVWRQLVAYFREYLGDDAKGRSKADWCVQGRGGCGEAAGRRGRHPRPTATSHSPRFLPSHLDFLSRYRPMPASVYGGADPSSPLLLRRDDVADAALGESLTSLTRLERLLRCSAPAAHAEVLDALWRSDSDADAVRRMQALADASLDEWETGVKAVRREDGPARGGRDGRDDGVAGG